MYCSNKEIPSIDLFFKQKNYQNFFQTNKFENNFKIGNDNIQSMKIIICHISMHNIMIRNHFEVMLDTRVHGYSLCDALLKYKKI